MQYEAVGESHQSPQLARSVLGTTSQDGRLLGSKLSYQTDICNYVLYICIVFMLILSNSELLNQINKMVLRFKWQKLLLTLGKKFYRKL